MIAARPIQDLRRGFGRNAFDLPVAALAGLAAAFLAFAMPADLLERLVVATGLPHLLAAAEPPLGFKARAMIGVAGAAVSFALAYLLLRMLDRSGREKARPVREMFEEAGPRLRRRDLHPDAPVCRPISAARDFGEPAPPAPPLPPLPEQDEEPAPPWFAAAEPDIADPLPEPAFDEPRPSFRGREIPQDAFGRQPITAVRDPDEPAPPVPEPAEPQAADPFPGPAQAEAEAEEEPIPADSAEPEEPLELTDRQAPAWLAAEEPQAAWPEPRAEPAAEASLTDLMQRLERGLARRRDRQVFATIPQQHAPAPQVFPEANDDRLQNAIESLQRFAARSEQGRG